jgi:4-amino-4-deoxy-L-arabinose transferase-like glycosyltransferase
MRNGRLLQLLSNLLSSPRTVFLVALAARLWVLLQLLPNNAWRYFYAYNEPSRIAWALVSGFGYSSPWPNTPLMPTAQQPPLYPLLLAGIFKVAGSYSYLSLWIAVALNAVFSALTAVLILQIGKRTFDASTGVLAAWVWSCWQYEAVVSIRLWESSLSALLLAVGLWLLPKLAVSLRLWLWLVFGVLAGVAALTNTTLLSVFPFFWLWLWIVYLRRGLANDRLLMASLVVCVLVVLPWTIRNYSTFNRLVPIRDNFGLELWLGNHEGVTHTFDSDFPILNPSEYDRLGEIGFMEAKRDVALEFIGRHPVTFLRLSSRRCFQFWSAPEKSVWLAVSLLAWLGMVLALWSKRLDGIPYALVMLIFPAIYYITHVFSTYRHPIEPVIVLLSAYAMASTARAAGNRLLRSPQSPPPGSGGVFDSSMSRGTYRESRGGDWSGSSNHTRRFLKYLSRSWFSCSSMSRAHTTFEESISAELYTHSWS